MPGGPHVGAAPRAEGHDEKGDAEQHPEYRGGQEHVVPPVPVEPADESGDELRPVDGAHPHQPIVGGDGADGRQRERDQVRDGPGGGRG